MARAKTAADEVYNARRRVQRAIERERKAGTSEAALRQMQAQATALRGRVTPEKIAAAREIQAQAVISAPVDKSGNVKRGSLLRRRAIFKQRLNTAGTETSDISKFDRDVFFSATKQIWAGKSSGDRIETILKHFYTSNSLDAQEFRQYVAEHKKDLPRMGYSTGSARDIELVFDWVLSKQQMDMLPAVYDGGTPIDFITINYIK